jgi:hypothetical protein
MSHFITKLAVAIALIGATEASALAEEKLNLVGNYTCEGTGTGGSTYKGHVSIAKQGETYDLTWKVGNETYSGKAVLHGNVLSACYVGGQIVGVVAYQIKVTDKGLVLSGKWTYAGGKKVYTEVLKGPFT